MKYVKKMLFVFLLIFLIFGFFNRVPEKRVYAKGLQLVFRENGDITWTMESTLATYDIVWKILGFHILLEETTYGFPFGRDNSVKRPHLKVEVRKEEVKVEHITKNPRPGQKIQIRNTIKWETLKKKIEENKEFYKQIKNKMGKTGKVTLYFNGFFESLVKVQNEVVKEAFLNPDSPKHRGSFKNGVYHYNGEKYDLINSAVYKIRKTNLINADMIGRAENWRNPKEWISKESRLFNVPVEVVKTSNFIIKFVDEKGGLIGDEITESDGEKIKKFLKKNSEFKSRSKKDELLSEKEFKRLKYKSRSGIQLNPRIGFRVKDSFQLSLEKEEKPIGSTVYFKMPRVIIHPKNQNKYRLIGCYFLNSAGKKVYQKKIRDQKVEDDGFLKFDTRLDFSIRTLYGEYVEDGKIKEKPPDVLEGEGEVNPVGEVGSGILENNPFDIEDGMPVTEAYYKRVQVEDYILNYRFVKKTGKKTYQARSMLVWNLSRQEKEGTGKDAKTVTKRRKEIRTYTTPVTRSFSYWVIDRLEYYTIDGAVIENQALSDSGVKMLPKQYRPPNLEFRHFPDEASHVRKPKLLNGVINLGEMNGMGNSIPFYDPTERVNALVGGILVKNDSLEMDGRLLMDGRERETDTPTPTEPPTAGNLCTKKCLYEEGKTIEKDIKNAVYESKGSVSYALQKSVNPLNPEILVFEMDDVNSIRIHTPVVCDYMMDDAKEWCQLIEPKPELFQLVLTKDFDLEVFSGGEHLPIKGYGYRDYEKYTLKKEVIFPFDVVNEGRRISAEVPVPMNKKRKFFVPQDVKEGIYSVLLKSYSLNSEGDEDKTENYANTGLNSYVATRVIQVEVSGRLIDFTLLNVKNTSLWEEVFKQENEPSGLRLDVLPLIKGDHPVYDNIGDFKKGYALEIAVTTIGEYLHERYGVEMDLSFFVYNDDFTERKEADVYYEAVSERTGDFLGLVKAGSKADRENLHFYTEKGYKVPIFTYQKIRMPNELLHEKSSSSIQRWRTEYSLPARLYICEKGTDLRGKINQKTGIFPDEDFFIKKGKLVVKADIYSLKNKKRILSYINAGNEGIGHLNNWKYETKNRRKLLNRRPVYFQDGEVFVFDIAKSIWLERLSRIRKRL